MFASIATLGNPRTFGKTFLSDKLCNQGLPCSKDSNQVLIGGPTVQEQCRTLSSLCRNDTSSMVLGTLGGFWTSGFYAQNPLAMRPATVSASPVRATSVGQYPSVVVNVGSSPKDFFEASMNDKITRKEVAVRSSDP